MNKTNMANTKKLTYCALFAAIATILMYFELPLPFMPPFLKVDLSGTVSLLAAYMFGWLPAVLITLVKNLIHLPMSSSGGVGQLADFLMTSTFCIVSVEVYKRKNTRAGAIFGLSMGTIAMSIIGIFTNYYLLIPFYSQLMPIDAIISMCNEVNPLIGTLETYLIFGVTPFNLIKGAILSLVTMLLYKRLSRFLTNEKKMTLQTDQEKAY